MLALREIPGIYARKHEPLPIEALDDLIKTACEENVLPIERGARVTIDNEVQKLKHEITVATRGLDKDFPRINMNFMRINKKIWCKVSNRDMKRRLSLPQFSYFDVFTSDGTISLYVTRDIKNHEYFDIASLRSRMRGLRGSVTLCDSFKGVIPLPTKTKILANRVRFDSIMFVKEADWNVELVLPNPDPLVIGKVGHIHFLIDVFDLTSVEQYIADKFTRANQSV